MNRTIALVFKAALGAGLARGFTAAPHGDAHADDTTVIFEDDPRWSCVDDGNRSADPAMRKVYQRDGTTRAACLSIRGQSTPTPTTTARTWAFSPDRPRQARPSAFELGPFGAYGWRGGAGASRGIVYGWLTGAGCVLRGADPSHRVKLGFVFLTCVLSVFSGQ